MKTSFTHFIKSKWRIWIPVLFFFLYNQSTTYAADCGVDFTDITLQVDCEGSLMIIVDGKSVDSVFLTANNLGAGVKSPVPHADELSLVSPGLDVRCDAGIQTIAFTTFPDLSVSGTYTFNAAGTVSGPTNRPSGGTVVLSSTFENPTCTLGNPNDMDGSITVTLGGALADKCEDGALIDVTLNLPGGGMVTNQDVKVGQSTTFNNLGEGTYSVSATVDQTGCPCALGAIASLNSITLAGPSLGTRSLACNANVNISLSAECTATIEIGDILRGSTDPCANAAMMAMIDSIVLKSGGTVIAGSGSVAMPAIILNADVTAGLAGMPLTVEVIDMSGDVLSNLCWGTVTLEDKSPPVVTCNDPGIADIVCLEFDGDVMSTIDDLVQDCSDFTTTIVAQSEITNCDNLPDSVLRRVQVTYFAEDVLGNRSNVCEDVINVLRFDTLPGDGFLQAPGCITFPPQFVEDTSLSNPNRMTFTNVIKVPDDNLPLQCTGNYVRLDPDDPDNPAPAPLSLAMGGSGSPLLTFINSEGQEQTNVLAAINFTNAPDSYKQIIADNLTNCGIGADFADLIFNFGCKIKIQRQWFLREWSCEGELVDTLGVQEIIISDTQAPMFLETIDDIEQTVDSEECSRLLTIPTPVVFDSCDMQVDLEIAIFDMDDNLIGPPLVNGIPSPTFEFPVGMSFIVYTAFDDCGNQASDTTKVTVMDETPPVVICKEFLVIGISGDGNVRIPVTSIDNGTYDQCDLDRVCVTRMDDLDLYLSLAGSATRVLFSRFNDALQARADNGGGCYRDYSEQAYLVGDRFFISENRLCTPYIDLCCADIANQGDEGIMVQVSAFDTGGNSSRCMTFVELQDKNPAVITCPRNITVDCNFEFPDFVGDYDNIADDPFSAYFGSIVTEGNQKRFGVPDEFIISPDPLTTEFVDGTVFDNCSIPRISSRILDQRDGCGVGRFVRQIFSNETGSPVIVCTQVINIESNVTLEVELLFEDLEEEVTLEGCMTPEEIINESFGTPNLADVEVRCSDLAISTENQLFLFNGTDTDSDACFKVVRTFTVIDWCQSEPGIPYVVGVFRQVIKVNDPDGPELTCADDLIGDNAVEITDCVEGEVMLMATAFDECTQGRDHVWSGRIELDTDGDGVFETFDDDLVINVQVTGDRTSKATHIDNYPLGTHRITWTVSDQCGNFQSCVQNFTVVNVKKPTPFAIDITTVLMPVDQPTVEVWAADLDNGKSVGPCGETLRMSMVRVSAVGNRTDGGFGISQAALSFNCGDVGEDGVDVNYFVFFDAGGGRFIFDFTTVNIKIQDNNGVCQSVTSAFLTGSVQNDVQENLPNVSINLMRGDNNTTMQSVVTNTNGDYAFPAMPLGGSYIIDPSADDDYLNGVTTLDLILIQKHILGLQDIESPYRIIAADINNDSKLSTADLVDLRSVILGYKETFENNESWRFIDKSYVFEDPQYPLGPGLDEQYSIASLETNMHIDFIGMKVGDINGSVEAASLLSSGRSAYIVDATDKVFSRGEDVSITLSASQDLEALGLQLGLNFDPSVLRFGGIEAITLDIDHNNIGTVSTREGELLISWDEVMGQPVQTGDQLFTLNFKALKEGRLSNAVTLQGSSLSSEIYNVDLEVMDVKIAFGTETTEAFKLYQNTPNPFTDQTTISFYLPAPTEVTLQINDITGKVIKNYTGSFDKGNNYINVSKTDLTTSGVLYYTLSTGETTDTKRMIVLK